MSLGAVQALCVDLLLLTTAFDDDDLSQCTYNGSICAPIVDEDPFDDEFMRWEELACQWDDAAIF
jgi:hypothetical protein